ncbi:MAG: single-stranded DNA-binding protein [Bacteroidales bacterium]|nr:single-stranded DNA-binding protein [Bacteroidales bacterium]
MEFLNHIELRGVVGRAEINTFNESRVCNFSVVTEYSIRDKEGNPAIDTAWFNVAAWEGRDMPDLYEIQKGAWVQVHGRVRIRKYTTQDNEERTAMDVLASSVNMIPRESTRPQPQRDW